MNFKVLDFSLSKSENMGFTISGSINSYMTVANIKQNGTAFKAGLQNGDCILMMNNVQIQSREDIINAIRISPHTLDIRVIRKNEEVKVDLVNSTNKNNKVIMRRRSIQEGGSLHRDFLQNMGSRVSMEITRAYPGTLKYKSNRIQYFENSMNPVIQENNESNHRQISNRISCAASEKINKSNSFQDIPNIPKTVNKVKNNRKAPPVPLKGMSSSHNSPEFMGNSASPRRTNITSLSESAEVKDPPVLNLSLRKKSKMGNIFSNQSLSNMSNFSKSFQNLPLDINIECSTKSFANNTSSMMSLFDEDCFNSHLTEYQIDWKAIYSKVSVTTINDIEKELISYFTNSHTNLRNFPVNSMYRYITFNSVLNVVFNSILSANADVDFHEEILKIPTEIYDIDYDMNSYNIIGLIKHNVKKMGGQIREYMERKSDLNMAKEKLKETLDEYLNKPEDSNKMHRQIDRIYKIFYELSNFLTSMVIAMSMWKFSKDFSHLYESMSYQTNILTTSENMLAEFRRSQKNLEQNIINLFRRFKEESSEDVLKIFDKLFSETLDLSICIPLFHDKLKRDNEMLGHLESGNVRELTENSRRLQYV